MLQPCVRRCISCVSQVEALRRMMDRLDTIAECAKEQARTYLSTHVLGKY